METQPDLKSSRQDDLIRFPINGLEFRDITTGGELSVERKLKRKKKKGGGGYQLDKRDPDIKMS